VKKSPAAVAAVALGAAVVAVAAWLTPWRPLGPGAVPGGATLPAPAADFTAADLTRSAALDAALRWPAYLGLAASLVVVCALGFTPAGARLLGAVTSKAPGRSLAVMLAAGALSLVIWVAGLPFDVWRHSVVRAYGLSNQSWPAWAGDAATSLGVTVVVSAIVLLGLNVLMRRFPRRWWAGAAVAGFLFVVVASFGYPVLVEPLFNSFRPMPAGALRTELLRMARADGVTAREVLVADASRRTTTLNAYVSGFGATRRIVVYDTLLASAPPGEIRMIVAHELGHAKNRDVLVGTAIGGLGTAAGGCLLFLLLRSPRLLRRAGVESAADPRAAALILALVTLGTQLAGPAHNVVSRRIEARADVHALDLTRDPATFVAMQRSLAVRNISDLRPDLVEYILWSTHPATPERIALARDWARREQLAEP
jgi:STE24 endopeptidase